MVTMKRDMGGAAAVVGAVSAIARLKLKANVVGVIAACENMISGRSFRPGDIIGSMAGKSIYVGSTDAEGRLTLVDAIHYAIEKEGVSRIVDLATLTGAMVVSLGPRIAGAFAAPESLAELVRRIGERVGEPCWPMPLWEDYKDELKSDVADLKNVGERAGGAIHAALFLHRFVPENTPWVHLDIAGPAYAKKKGDHGIAGGTGFGVRILMELTREWPEVK